MNYRVSKIYFLGCDERKAIEAKIREELLKDERIIFTYLYGSFTELDRIRDIDVAVFWNEKGFSSLKQMLDSLFELSERLSRLVKNIPVDLQMLNTAPSGFRYYVTQGKLLFSRDENLHSEFLERTWDEYFDFKPIARQYLQEVLRG